jgi:uncharacterized protein (DUF169 family)
MDNGAIANRLTATLELGRPPVAVAFLDAPPPGVSRYEGEVPSACSFWRRAEGSVFWAAAEQHFNCAVGAMTMGFELQPEVQASLMGVVGEMVKVGYLGADEPNHIPTVARRSQGILYGPLADLPAVPDAVLVWLQPRQAMILNEALGQAAWGGGAGPRVFGRPACAALPAALEDGVPTFSMGCIGMRTFTEIAGDLMLAVLPAEGLEETVALLDRSVAANRHMEAIYQDQKARVGSGTD